MDRCKLTALSCAFAAALPAATLAETTFNNTSLTLLYGSDYEVVEDDQVVMTFEHVSGHNWGDLFFFVDRLQAKSSSSNDKETYGELSPRLSLSYLTGQSLSVGPIKDVYLAGTYEFNASGIQFDNYLYGFGLDWDVPGFNYVQTQFYYADNELQDNDLQLTLVWGMPISLGSHLIMFDGYIDWSTGENKEHASEFHFNPQVKLDVGNYFNNPGKYYVGIEYSYWHNKFGLKDADTENLVNALVKVHW